MGHTHNKQSDFGTGTKTLNVYIIGLIACAFLTLLPFAAVMLPMFFQATAVGLVVACAFAQFIIQLVCFLRLNYTTEQAKLNVKSFVFFIVVVLILVLGSLWIMDNLNYFMMH